MTTSAWKKPFTDSLYGQIAFEDEISELIRTPVVQRLRHVRLSNIDSIDMPGIANLSRFEHVLGVAHLASAVGFRQSLRHFDFLVLKASALLHDWAITSFGHLIEEALQYVGTAFEHESKLVEIISSEDSEEIGGIKLQILLGRDAGIKSWARKFAKQKHEELIDEITKHILGKGRMGRIISGDIDLDNIDNVFRMAFHMGLTVDKGIPLRLAQSIVKLDDRGIVLRYSAKKDIVAWLSMRQVVYEHLMLSERDFIGKVMMLYASVVAYKNGDISKADWNVVDWNLLNILLKSSTKEVSDTVGRWITGELWDSTPLYWMSGDRPDYPKLLEYSRDITMILGRQCFAYGIKDKRDRHLKICFDNGTRQEFGSTSLQWLIGVGSPKKKAFTQVEVKKTLERAQSFFNTKIISPATITTVNEDDQPCLF